MLCGIISVPRSGKHWLLCGIFDSINTYPDRYLETREFCSLPPNGDGKYCYYITYNNRDFISAHEVPDNISSDDRFIILDRRDRIKQAISNFRAISTGIRANYVNDSQKNLQILYNMKRVTRPQLRHQINHINCYREHIYSSLMGFNYLQFWYEDLLTSYDFLVRVAIKYLFNVKIKTVKKILTCHKLSYD